MANKICPPLTPFHMRKCTAKLTKKQETNNYHHFLGFVCYIFYT